MKDALDNLPSAPEVEDGLIGWTLSIAKEEEVIQLCDILTADDFYSSTNSMIYSGIEDMVKDGKRPDLVTLSQLLENTSIQSTDLINRIEVASVFGFHHAVQAASIIKDKATRRRTLTVLRTGMKDAHSSHTTGVEVIAHTEAELLRIADGLKDDRPTDVNGIMLETNQAIDENIKNGRLGYPTGFHKLDGALGGLIPSHIWVVGAYCMGKGTEVIMWDGSKRLIENIAVGDRLSPVNAETPRIVLETVQGQDDMFEVTGKYIDGFTVNGGHILPMVWLGDGYSKNIFNKMYNITVNEYLAKSKREQRGFRLIKAVAQYQPNAQALSIPPYLLGLWLGDGNRGRSVITVGNKETEILDYLKQYCAENNLICNIKDYKNDGVWTVGLSTKNGGDPSTRLHSLTHKLRAYHLLGNKHIPREYLTATVEERLELLAGLIDSDGSVSGAGNSVITFTNIDLTLLSQVRDLAESLGLNTSSREWDQRFSSLIKNWKPSKITKLSITGQVDIVPMKVTRKRPDVGVFRKKLSSIQSSLTFKITPIGREDYYGFQLDGNHLYLAKNYIIQHNTGTGKTFFTIQLALNVLAKGGKVAMFSTEMDRQSTYLRVLGNLAGVSALKLMKGLLTPEEEEKKTRAETTLATYQDQFRIYDNCYTTDQIRLKCKRQKLEIGLDLFTLDFVQNLRGSDSIYERMSQAAVELQQLCKEEKTCGVIMSQVSNEGGKSNAANAEVLQYKGAGELAAIADAGLWLNKSETPGKLQLLVRKSRHGISGLETYVDINYQLGGRMTDGYEPSKMTADLL